MVWARFNSESVLNAFSVLLKCKHFIPFSPLTLISHECISVISLEKYRTVSVDKKNQLDVTFVFFISLIIVAQHVSGNHVPIIRS